MRGLNFVIIDNFKNCVVDFFNIDTYSDKSFSINRPSDVSDKVKVLENNIQKTL